VLVASSLQEHVNIKLMEEVESSERQGAADSPSQDSSDIKASANIYMTPTSVEIKFCEDTS